MMIQPFAQSVKKLKTILKKHSGRDNTGSVSVRHQGGRHKRFYRLIDTRRLKRDIEGTVIAIHYDPNRTSKIALIEYEGGEKGYILHCEGLKIDMKVMAGEKAEISVGNATALKNIPLGTEIHNIELYPGKGGQLVRSAGGTAVVAAKEGKYVHLKLPSKEIRKVLAECYATIGRISNIAH
ncbi:MAG: 50S ribosomal protein L2, partial [Candidatus Roizmanbacteria bacterium]